MQVYTRARRKQGFTEKKDFFGQIQSLHRTV